MLNRKIHLGSDEISDANIVQVEESSDSNHDVRKQVVEGQGESVESRAEANDKKPPEEGWGQGDWSAWENDWSDDKWEQYMRDRAEDQPSEV